MKKDAYYWKDKNDLTEKMLELTMQTLKQIALHPRSSPARRNARATIAFIENLQRK